VRFRVEAWDPEYGTASEPEPATAAEPARVDVEIAAHRWAPIAPHGALAEPVVLFVDGVRRTEAFGWIHGPEDGLNGPDALDAEPCTFASYAAGIVRCAPGAATVTACEIGRGVASSAAELETVTTSCGEFRPIRTESGAPEHLNTAIQRAMTAIEVRLSFAARGDDPDALLVVDGPLRERRHVEHAVGLVKRHHVRYLGELDRVVATLGAGERTPVFFIPGSAKLSWYLRLPGPADGPWAGVVRLEAPAEIARDAVIALADRTAATLPRYASAAHKDGRAPQNLYPIGGLERALRHRLGDPAFVLRSLRSAAARR
jgi:hypothetical protein